MTAFYRAFEDRHRGARELILERLKVYLSFVLPLKAVYQPVSVLDLGCGRGEWLQLLSDHDFTVKGVDIDQDMLSACESLQLPVVKSEALTYLKQQADSSYAVVSAFHLVEHISFADLQLLVAEALRVLQPGGLLIMETPNPENIVVGTNNFYLDPTHERPIPQQLLSFIAEFQGFNRVKVLRLQEDPALHNKTDINLTDIFTGVSPDYAVIAQKEANQDILAQFDAEFNRDYGLSLQQLLAKWEQHFAQLTLQMDKVMAMENQLQQVNIQQAELGNQLEQHIAGMNNKVTDLQQYVESTVNTLLSAQQNQQQAFQQTLLHNVKDFTELISVKQELLEHKAQLNALQQTASTSQSQLQTALTELAAAQSTNHQHCTELQATKKELSNVHAANHQHWLLAEQRQQQINALLSSWSWRLTSPLRFVLDATKTPLSSLINLVKWPLIWPAKKLMVKVLANPQRAIRINHWLMQKMPFVHRHLRQFAIHRGLMREPFHPPVQQEQLIEAAANEVCNEQADLSHLTPRARQIYQDLTAAIAKNKE